MAKLVIELTEKGTVNMNIDNMTLVEAVYYMEQLKFDILAGKVKVRPRPVLEMPKLKV